MWPMVPRAGAFGYRCVRHQEGVVTSDMDILQAVPEPATARIKLNRPA